MEMPEPWCGIRYDSRRGGQEEELTLTPHHTPSQSFDFIVWEKAYLDSIPAAGQDAPNPPFNPNFDATTLCVHRPPSSATMCVAGPSLHHAPSSMCVHIGPYDNLNLSLHKESLVPHSPSGSTLMACRTDADLPLSFIDYKPRTSDADLTALEEAVRLYAHRHPHAIGSPSPNRCSSRHRTHCAIREYTAHLNANHEVLLRRSYSQPGGGISKGLFGVGCNQPTWKNKLAAGSVPVFAGHAQIYQDQFNARLALPAPNHTKMSCFPTSPGRRKRGKSALDHDRESMQSAEISENHTSDLHQQQEKLRSPACYPTLDIQLQQQNYKLLSPAAWADVMYMQAVRHPRLGMHDMVAAPGFYENSFSDMSSDYDHHHDAASALDISKMKLWGLHHRFKALCRKLCSFCTF